MYCRSVSRHTAPLTALSRDAVSLPVWATGFRHSFDWVKHPCYNSQPLSYSYHILLWLEMCSHQCVWVLKCWYHCCSNLDLSTGSMYHAFPNNYAHKSSIWLVSEKDSEKDIDTWLSLPADPPMWTTIFPDPAMLQLPFWPFWLLTFSSYSLGFEAGMDWKISLTHGKHFVIQKLSAPLLNTI